MRNPGVEPRKPVLRFFLATIPGFLTLAGCASNHPVTGAGGIRAITEAEIQASDADDVLELIQELRPAWLAGSVLGDPSDPNQTVGPTVLIDDIPPKPLFSLQFLSLEDVREIHFLTRTAAETRFRVGARHGLILVLTRSRVIPKDTLPPDTGWAGTHVGARALGGPGAPETRGEDI